MRDKGKNPKPQEGDNGWSLEVGVFTIYQIDEDADSVLVTNYYNTVIELTFSAFEGNWSETGDGIWMLSD